MTLLEIGKKKIKETVTKPDISKKVKMEKTEKSSFTGYLMGGEDA